MSNGSDFHDELQNLKEDLQDEFSNIKDEFIDVGMEMTDSFLPVFGIKTGSRVQRTKRRRKTVPDVDFDSKSVLVKFDCPSCGANLQNINALNPGKCEYCGEQIILDSNSRMQAEIKLKELENERYMFDKRQERRKEGIQQARKHVLRTAPLFLLMALIPLSILGIGSYMDRKDINRLHEIEAQVEEYYMAGDYEAALLKANQLVYDGSWSDGKVWDEKRENLIKIIEKAMKNNE